MHKINLKVGTDLIQVSHFILYTYSINNKLIATASFQKLLVGAKFDPRNERVN